MLACRMNPGQWDQILHVREKMSADGRTREAIRSAMEQEQKDAVVPGDAHGHLGKSLSTLTREVIVDFSQFFLTRESQPLQ
jgi:hypothetical protein